MDALGTVLESKYKLLKRIGEGGMGSVYEARHLLTDRRVAVKFLHPDLAKKPEVRMRFEREARAAGRVDHENVCEVLDSGVGDDGSRYLVMPLLQGRSLKELIKSIGPLPFERVVDIAMQILDALAVAHGRGVIHRDLKPGNVFLTLLGGRQDFVKILDFGVTKFEEGLDAREDMGSLTRTGAVLGTPCYMAPEQARGSKDIDGQVDVYAVGVILYEMLTGKRPIEGETYNEVLWQLWNAPVKHPTAFRPELSPELESVVLKAMARNRDKRYKTAEDMREDLQVAAKSIQPESFRPPRLEDHVEEGETHPFPGTADAETPLPTFPATSAESELVDDAQAPVETVSPRRRTGWLAVVAVVLAVGLVASVAAWLSTDTPADAGSSATVSPPGVEPAAPSVETPAAETPVEPHQRTRIVLEGVPEGAAVSVDGRAVDGTTIDVERADRELAVVVRAVGFRPWERQLSASRDASVPVQLEREGEPAAAVESQPPTTTQGQGAPPRREPPTTRPRPPGKQTFGPIETFGEVP